MAPNCYWSRDKLSCTEVPVLNNDSLLVVISCRTILNAQVSDVSHMGVIAKTLHHAVSSHKLNARLHSQSSTTKPTSKREYVNGLPFWIQAVKWEVHASRSQHVPLHQSIFVVRSRTARWTSIRPPASIKVALISFPKYISIRNTQSSCTGVKTCKWIPATNTSQSYCTNNECDFYKTEYLCSTAPNYGFCAWNGNTC
jgi:hypothetical protein